MSVSDTRHALGETEAVARRFATSGSRADLDRLATLYRPVVVGLSRRYARRSGAEDLEQAAAMGLVKAARRYDPRRGPFRPYAIATMVGEIKHFCRADEWILHVPRPVQERLLRVRELSRDIEQETGRAPSVRELAGALGVQEDSIVEALCAGRAARALSLDAICPDLSLPLSECVGSAEAGYERVDCLVSIQRALPRLSQIERRVVRLRFDGDLSQGEIAAVLGIPSRRVARILRRALEGMGRTLTGAPAPTRRRLA